MTDFKFSIELIFRRPDIILLIHGPREISNP